MAALLMTATTALPSSWLVYMFALAGVLLGVVVSRQQQQLEATPTFIPTTQGGVPVQGVFSKNPWTGFPGNQRWTPAFPDQASRYDVLTVQIKTGNWDGLILKGQFPYARYFGINLYDYHKATDFDSLLDQDIEPDADNQNPFLADASVNRTQIINRNYTVYLVKQSRTPFMISFDENNENIMIFPDQDLDMLTIMTRVYRPDDGRDLLGGVSLPTVEAFQLDQSKAVAPKRGTLWNGMRTKLPMFVYNRDLINTWNVMYHFSLYSPPQSTTFPPLQPIVFYRTSDDGLFANGHMEYIVAPLADDYQQQVAVVMLPQPPTYLGQRQPPSILGTENQTTTTTQTPDVRYWSFCLGDLSTTGTPACLRDDQHQAEPSDQSVLFVIAPPNLVDSLKGKRLLRGNNYMTWESWMPMYKPLLIHRQMLAANGYEGRIAKVPPIGRPPLPQDCNAEYMQTHRAEHFMGNAAPRGIMVSADEFQRRLQQTVELDLAALVQEGYRDARQDEKEE